MKKLLPDEYDILIKFTDSLPGGATSPVYPFAGLVININVCTEIHRDRKDAESLCMVVPLFDRDTIGGHLCIQELGLVMGMKSLDVVIFKSALLTHFNLHYTGKRASLVFKSDYTGATWVKDQNGWIDNIYMRAGEIGVE